MNGLRLSPDGKHIAGTISKWGVTRAIVYDSATLEPSLLESKSGVLATAASVSWFNEHLLVIESNSRGTISSSPAG